MNLSAKKKVYIDNIELKCQHCKNDKFYDNEYLLNTRGFTFLGIEWLNRDAEVFICEQCGFMHWFFPYSNEMRKLEIRLEDVKDEIENE